jgi:tetratricopeptide (TPR) repeat protein
LLGTRDSTFSKLQRLAAGFEDATAASRAAIRLATALGPIAVPCCVRELAGDDPGRRQRAIVLLGSIAEHHGDRVRRALAALAAGDAHDDAKVDALALLAELGAPEAHARFADPARVQRRSVEQLATHLASPAEIASATALVVDALDPDAIVDLVEGMVDAAPVAARRLAGELTARVDVDPALRSEVRRIAAPLALSADDAAPGPAPGRARIAILRHPGGRAVVAVARRVPGARRWRTLGVLVDEAGALVDAWYDDDCPPRKLDGEVLAPLAAEGFTGETTRARAADARRLVADAARHAVARGLGLPAPYYLGRDLLELGDAHLAGQPVPDGEVTLLARAVDLLAAGEAARARPLLDHCALRAPDDAIAASSLGLCLCAQGEPAAAIPWLERAARLEPTWPLHHWNLAAAAHQAGEPTACYLALAGFVARGAAVAGDAEHDDRLAQARRWMAAHERRCRMEGVEPPRIRAGTRTRTRRRARPGARAAERPTERRP